VVVLGAAAQRFPPGMADALAVASDPRRATDARLAALRACMFAPGNDPAPWLAGWYPQWRAAYRAAALQPPRDTWFAVAHAPLFDLQGAQDAWRPPATRGELRDAIGRGVTVQVIDGAGHALVPEQPGAVARAIVDWVRRLG
jgi:pimeloyl-ACP methyl ester carboxylesterase